MFLSASEIFTNIVDGLRVAWETVKNLNWLEVWEYFKNIGLAGAALIAIRYGVPFLKGKTTNKMFIQLLNGVQALGSTVEALKTDNKTLKDGMSLFLSNIEATCSVNATSVMLTAEQKQVFLDIAAQCQAFKPLLAEKIISAVEDGKLTATEGMEIAQETSPEVAQTLLTPISDLLPKTGE